MKNIATIEITTFRGTFGATHWYGKLTWWKDGEFYHDEIKRPITQNEIDSRPDRFYGYKNGDETNAFNRWLDVVKMGKRMIDAINVDLDVRVIGVPNCDKLSYIEAVDPNLDTRCKCSNCGHVFESGEGRYNYPGGRLCISCNEEK
ncbi:MAG: hypothetical protein ACRDD8_02935 [Bacteroidales bacterium]